MKTTIVQIEIIVETLRINIWCMPQTEKNRHHNFYILNIKLRKHHSNLDSKPEDYIRLLRTVYTKKNHRESSQGKHCIFKFMFEEKEGGEVIYLSGTFFQFTFIKNEKWVNLNSLDFDEEFNPKSAFENA